MWNAVAANADRALGRAADLVLTLPQAREAWTGSTIAGC
jgi:D-arabinose 5-phosphate isomerase GutQ